MKKLLLLIATITLSSPAWSQPVDLTTVLGANRSFHDPVFGVKLTYPPGWEVVGGQRWGKSNGENTFRLQPVWPAEARPSVYYQRFTPDHPRPSDFEAYYRDAAERKAASRREGIKDYLNRPETFSFGTIAGQPSFNYFASFTVGSRPMAEYFVRISGATTQVMIFTQGPAAAVEAVRAEIDAMAQTVRVP